MSKLGAAAWLMFVATVLVANWAVERYGIINVGFGLMAPAAVFVVGVAFTLRDIVHRTLGRWWAVAAIVVGCALSFIVSPTFALASAAAFGASELVDLGIFELLQERFVLAVAASNVVGLVVDSIVFLLIGFGSLEFFWGQAIGKAWMTLLALPIVYGFRRALLPRHA